MFASLRLLLVVALVSFAGVSASAKSLGEPRVSRVATTPDSVDVRTARLARLCAENLHLSAVQQEMMHYYLNQQQHSLFADLQAGAMPAAAAVAEGRKRMDEVVSQLLDESQLNSFRSLLNHPLTYNCLRGLMLAE